MMIARCMTLVEGFYGPSPTGSNLHLSGTQLMWNYIHQIQILQFKYYTAFWCLVCITVVSCGACTSLGLLAKKAHSDLESLWQRYAPFSLEHTPTLWGHFFAQKDHMQVFKFCLDFLNIWSGFWQCDQTCWLAKACNLSFYFSLSQALSQQICFSSKHGIYTSWRKKYAADLLEVERNDKEGSYRPIISSINAYDTKLSLYICNTCYTRHWHNLCEALHTSVCSVWPGRSVGPMQGVAK